jgi:hypothetical protein
LDNQKEDCRIQSGAEPKSNLESIFRSEKASKEKKSRGRKLSIRYAFPECFLVLLARESQFLGCAVNPGARVPTRSLSRPENQTSAARFKIMLVTKCFFFEMGGKKDEELQRDRLNLIRSFLSMKKAK